MTALAPTPEAYDIAIGLTIAQLNYQLSSLHRTGLIEDEFEVEYGGDTLRVVADAPTITIPFAQTFQDGLRLVLNLEHVTWNGQALPPSPWVLSVAAPLGLSDLSPAQWRAHERLPASLKTKLEIYADEALWQVKRLSIQSRQLDLSTSLREAESKLPPLDPGVRAGVLRLLGVWLRGLVGPKNPFNFLFPALSRDPERTSPKSPEFEPVSVHWGLCRSGNPEKSQVRCFLMNRGRDAPATPNFGDTLIPLRHLRGSLVLSAPTLFDRFVLPQVRRAMGVKAPMIKTSNHNSVTWTCEEEQSIETVREYQPSRGQPSSTRFLVLQTLTVTVQGIQDTNAAPGRRASISTKVSYARTCYLRRETDKEWSFPLYSSVEASCQNFIGVADEAVLNIATDFKLDKVISKDVQDQLERWTYMRGYSAWLALRMAARLSSYHTEIRQCGTIRFQLPHERVLLPSEGRFIFSDPTFGREAAMMGDPSLTLDLVIKR